jgi:hypothetical protein
VTKLRVLSFDIENRPLSYLGQDFTTAEITAIASCWHGEPASMAVGLLGREEPAHMLEFFVQRYNAADIVTGHYIRGHDLPKINGALLELGLEPLSEKETVDTKLDLVSHGHVVSASQENLSETLGIRAPKVHMNTPRWREANRLTPAGLALTEKRVAGDVRQHMQLYRRLVELGLLRQPSTWRP